MSKKRKGKYELSEALSFLEATTVQNYPDNGTGVSTDDDRPPGNIVYGEKYKRTPYYNRLTNFQKSWEVDTSDWKWDEFKMSGGMEDKNNYSNTLRGLKNILPPETWNNIVKRYKYVSPAKVARDFDKALQPWRKAGEDQTGGEEAPHMEIGDYTNKKGKEFDSKLSTKKMDSKKKKVTEKIDMLTV